MIPSNIALFNDRGAYRAPFEQEPKISVMQLFGYDPEREEPLDFLNQAKEIDNTTIHLLDLSSWMWLPHSTKHLTLQYRHALLGFQR